MKTFFRDSTVFLKFNFFDHLGNPLNPVTASVTISYMPVNGDCATYTKIPLVQDGDDWTTTWDSRGASPCVVQAHAQTEDGPPIASVDSEFRLKANRANRELTGDW